MPVLLRTTSTIYPDLGGLGQLLGAFQVIFCNNFERVFLYCVLSFLCPQYELGQNTQLWYRKKWSMRFGRRQALMEGVRNACSELLFWPFSDDLRPNRGLGGCWRRGMTCSTRWDLSKPLIFSHRPQFCFCQTQISNKKRSGEQKTGGDYHHLTAFD